MPHTKTVHGDGTTEWHVYDVPGIPADQEVRVFHAPGTVRPWRIEMSRVVNVETVQEMTDYIVSLDG